MNINPMTKMGVNDADVYTEEGVGDYRVTLFTMLNRGLEISYIQENVKKIIDMAKEEQIRDLFVMAFQTRDVRGGKGERKLFYDLITAVYKYKPDIVAKLIPLVPEYGCWRDLWELLKVIPDLKDYIFAHVAHTFKSDLIKSYTSKETSMTLLAKWLPREGSGNYPGLAKQLANHIYAEEKSERRRIIQYRKDTSKMNKALKTVEINMCGKTWSQIEPEAVPGRCLKIHSRAFLNMPLGKKADDDELRYPNDEDRMECRRHFIEFSDGIKTGEKKAHGANVVMPHELVVKALDYTATPEELTINQGQWDSIREETLKLGGLGKCVPMCDFSGSMDGTPKEVSLALGILISEINHSAFKDHILTFDAEPQWHSFASKKTLKEKLDSIGGRLGQGLNTDFYKAAMCILNKMKEHKVPVGEEPEDLIVLTDMGFDNASYDTRYDNKTRRPKWETQLEMIRNEFKRIGEEVWGEGNGWKSPRIVIWNLRAEYKDFHAKAGQEGVVQLSGWSPSILKALQKGGVQVMTPYQGMRLILDDVRYDPVRKLI